MAVWTVERPERLAIDEPVTRLDVYLVSGRLNVVGTDGPPRVEVTEAGRKPITIRMDNGGLSIRHENVRKWPGLFWWLGRLGRRFRVDISVAVPPETVADLRLVEGSVVASGLLAGAEVSVTSGRITLLGLAGRVAAKLVSGPVEALGVGGDLTMETISGELTLADSTASRVHATTISGAITCDLDNPADSEIRLNTTSGPITVRVRADSDLAVHLHTTSGRITSGFPELAAEIDQPWGVKDVRGVLGAGAGKLWASSTSGSVALLARPVES
jgi:hypothetical protein